MTKKLFTTVAASVALVATPVLAQGAVAERNAAPVDQAEELGGRGEGQIIGIAALGLIIAGLVVAFSGGDDDDLPTSP